MKEAWFTTLEPRDKTKRDFAVSRPTLDKLAQMLLARMKKPSENDYKNPAWAYYRADADGYNRALTEVLELIKES